MKTIIFTKNDIWRVLGILLLVGGQFASKDSFSGFGVTLESNLIQIAGAILLLLPFALRGIALYKGRKDNTTTSDDSQG